MHCVRFVTLFAALALSGCLFTPTLAPPEEQANSDRLLLAGIRELSENRPPAALETLVANHPHGRQAALASQLLEWKRQQPQRQAKSRNLPETELRELREENRRLRNDLEQLRRLLIDTERRAR